jgi:hypothetical protein
VVRSTSKLAAVSVVPSMVIDPVTSPVRPTAVVEPIAASSSWMRNPANVPVALSKSNSPVSVSTTQEPLIPSTVPVAEPSSAEPEPESAPATDSTAASRLTSAGASSFRNHHTPPAPAPTSAMTAAPMSSFVRVVIPAR